MAVRRPDWNKHRRETTDQRVAGRPGRVGRQNRQAIGVFCLSVNITHWGLATTDGNLAPLEMPHYFLSV